MVSTSVATTRRGRPRSQVARTAVLEAAMQLIASVPPDAVTIAAITRVAKVGKATIYRWWPTRGALLLEALAEVTSQSPRVVDATSVRTALIVNLRALLEVLDDPQLGPLVVALVREAHRNEQTAAAFTELWLVPRRESLKTILLRGIRSGALRADVDIEIALDQFLAPVFRRIAIAFAPQQAIDAERCVDALLVGLAAPRA